MNFLTLMEWLITAGYIYAIIGIFMSVVFLIMSVVSHRTTFLQCLAMGFAFPAYFYAVYRNTKKHKRLKKKYKFLREEEATKSPKTKKERI